MGNSEDLVLGRNSSDRHSGRLLSAVKRISKSVCLQGIQDERIWRSVLRSDHGLAAEHVRDPLHVELLGPVVVVDAVLFLFDVG